MSYMTYKRYKYGKPNHCKTTRRKTKKVRNKMNKAKIAKLTNKWIKEVSINNNPVAITKLFCPRAKLIGTFSKINRNKDDDIKEYFEYFAKLKGLRVLSKLYNIQRLDDRVFVNTVEIKWMWDALNKPNTTRMTFIYRDGCIAQLHSSVLPESNDYIK
jgi:hypothetical protein